MQSCTRLHCGRTNPRHHGVSSRQLELTITSSCPVIQTGANGAVAVEPLQTRRGIPHADDLPLLPLSMSALATHANKCDVIFVLLIYWFHNRRSSFLHCASFCNTICKCQSRRLLRIERVVSAIIISISSSMFLVAGDFVR